MAIVLNFEDVKAWADKAVEHKPHNYIYVNGNGQQMEPGRDYSCEYVHQGDGKLVPSCIVGQILDSAGVNLDPLLHSGSASDIAIDGLVREGFIEKPSDKVKTFLQVAQSCQDGGLPWSKAVQIASRAVENL